MNITFSTWDKNFVQSNFISDFFFKVMDMDETVPLIMNIKIIYLEEKKKNLFTDILKSFVVNRFRY